MFDFSISLKRQRLPSSNRIAGNNPVLNLVIVIADAITEILANITAHCLVPSFVCSGTVCDERHFGAEGAERIFRAVFD